MGDGAGLPHYNEGPVYLKIFMLLHKANNYNRLTTALKATV